ncbi:hypothetical protein [uncultured Apibacter sp.]|nr:hypothetical protein [uncultured Apibacter sp.]
MKEDILNERKDFSEKKKFLCNEEESVSDSREINCYLSKKLIYI